MCHSPARISTAGPPLSPFCQLTPLERLCHAGCGQAQETGTLGKRHAMSRCSVAIGQTLQQ